MSRHPIDVRATSAIPPIADIHQRGVHVRLVPIADLADRHRVRKLRMPSRVRYGTLQDSCWLQNCPRWAQSAPNYFIVIASPLRSAFAISPTCRPESSRMAPFWLVSTIARTPPPTASPAPAAA